jgi:hypothetical protein
MNFNIHTDDYRISHMRYAAAYVDFYAGLYIRFSFKYCQFYAKYWRDICNKLVVFLIFSVLY